jgi:cyclopropane fatty-acyl-phospholipid synthase-like methyltransferase
MSALKKHPHDKSIAKKPRMTMAKKADKHRLYERAVQCSDAEIDFVDQTFQALTGRQASSLREDFCGTTNSSCEWIRRRDTNRAVCVDLDEEVLAWGLRHHVGSLTEEQKARIQLIQADVMTVTTDRVDMVLAMNFSYWLFKDRPTMVQYFRRVYQSLKDDGVFFLDACGGFEAFREMEEMTEHSNFTYVWDQSHYNPITGQYLCKIHFKFKDGSKLKDAFVYDWRLWTLPEITEMLAEAGFEPTVYWEGTDEDGEGDGVFTASTQGEADAGWIVYISGAKKRGMGILDL